MKLKIVGMSLLMLAAAGGPAAAAPPQPHTITVTGQGEVKAVPDEAVLTAGVETEAATAGDALAANRKAMNEVFAELKREGISDHAIRTSAFNIFPQYAPVKDDSTPPHIVDYRVSNNISITVDDLGKLGPAIDALVASGANSMAGISFTIRDPKPLLRQARDAAVKDAMDRAQTYAKAAAVSLGRVIEIDEGGVQEARPLYRQMAIVGGAAPTSIAAGEQTVSAQVTVTFEIK
jgi:uncharacterized protein